MLGALLVMMVYWIAPQQLNDTLDELIGRPPAKQAAPTTDRR
jgi:hypothetical protein